MVSYSVGAVVRLKSGGPEMTITDSFPNEKGEILYRTQWFDVKKLCEGIFHHETVEYEGD